jgi:bifunctional N-acetylglucosamine-1-phosphate-uridyltransferase/glucosamine-1-phosphate-acetyltransferase GlmU-like protein
MAINNSSIAGVVYFTGTGKDLPGNTASILQPLLGQPVLMHTLEIVRESLGKPASLLVDQEIAEHSEKGYLEDDLVLHTGHSNLVETLKSHYKGKAEHLLLVPADMPLLTAPTIGQLIAAHTTPGNPDQTQPV